MSIFSTKIKLVAPLTGEIKDITEVDDLTFSQKLLGDGIAIVPEDGELLAPQNAKVIQVFHTKHAITLDIKGLRVLIHVGVDTVELKGNGFEVYVKEGDSVKLGDKLMKIDLDLLKELDYTSETSILICNSDEYKSIDKNYGHVTKGKDIIFEVQK